MSKISIILTLLLGCCQLLPGQEWRVRYTGTYPDGYTRFIDGFTDEEGVTFLVGQEGPDKEHAASLLLRLDSDGTYSALRSEDTVYHSIASCIVETEDHRLFVAGKKYHNDGQGLLIRIFDKELHLLEERVYEAETDILSFGQCKGIRDKHGHIVVSTYVVLGNGLQGTDYRGVFYTFDDHGNEIRHRYLIEEYPHPVYFLTDFRMRQMWFKGESDTLLCLVPGYGGVMSFVSFDTTFNYLEEYPIWREQADKSDHTLFQDCYTDYWYSDNEALFFSSRGDADHNKLRISRVNTQGEFLDFIRLNERPDTIDDAARPRCMAATDDHTFYFSFHSHQQSYYPGIPCVYMLNDKLEIIGSHVDIHDTFRACLILPTPDGGCITVNDSCNYAPYMTTTMPVIQKLTPDDFDRIPWTVSHDEQPPLKGYAFPNPCSEILNIPVIHENYQETTRCRVEDLFGRITMDCIVQSNGKYLFLDVSNIRAGIYRYRIYSDRKTLSSGQFVKQ